MTQDPLDRLGARLFEAARSEAPAKGAEQRALLAALSEARTARVTVLPRRAAWAAVASVAVLAASVALLMQRRKPAEQISAEPASAHSAAKPAPRAAVSAPSSSAPQKPAPAPAPSNVRSQLTAPLPSASAAATLSDELDALKVASTALAAGDPGAALAALDRYDHVLKGSKLRAEATLLRIQALARSGNAQAASTLAQRFVDQNPDSPLVDRARSFIQTPGLGGN